MNELYGYARGANLSLSNEMDGITIEAGATGRTLAHEIGHACGLKDIYTSLDLNGTNVSLENTPVQLAFLPGDWCHDAPNGGYGPLKHPEIVIRLLMLGIDIQNAVDIPSGAVLGLNKNGQTNLVNVGLEHMNRQPSHW